MGGCVGGRGGGGEGFRPGQIGRRERVKKFYFSSSGAASLPNGISWYKKIWVCFFFFKHSFPIYLLLDSAVKSWGRHLRSDILGHRVCHFHAVETWQHCSVACSVEQRRRWDKVGRKKNFLECRRCHTCYCCCYLSFSLVIVLEGGGRPEYFPDNLPHV